MSRDSITFFRSYLEAAAMLPPERFKPFILSIGAYAFDDEQPSFEPMSLEGMAFLLIAPVIDKSKERAAAGAKGGRAKKDSLKVASSSSKQLEQDKDKEQDREKERNNTQYYSLEADTDTDKEKAKDVDTYVSTEKKKEKKEKFSPPTVEQVAAYCTERNNGIDPDAFIAYYESQGWKKANGTKVVDWKGCVRTWESRHKDSQAEQRKDEPWHWTPITAEVYDA